MLILDGLVDDAEQMQFKEGVKAKEVKGWLNKLQHAVYHLEELLRQWRQITTTTTTIKSLRLRFKVFSTAKKPDKDIKVQIRETLESLEALVKEKDVLDLTESATWRESLQGLPSSSDVLHDYFNGNYPKDCFYGRDEEEMSILENLLLTS